MKRWYSNGMMTGSLLLLLLFLVYWNVDNFDREKGKLKKELEYQAQLTSAEVNETVLWAIVEDFMDDSTAVSASKGLKLLSQNSSSDSISFSFAHDSVRGTSFISSMKFDTIVGERPKGFLDMNCDSSVAESRVIWKDLTTKDSKNHKSERRFELSIEDHRFPTHSKHVSDKVILEFKNRLQAAGLPDEFNLVTTDDFVEDPKSLYIKLGQNRFSSTESFAEFSDFTNYLLKKMLPAFLISCALFLLLCFSFYLLYNSWREQMRLNQIKSEFVSNMTHELKTPIATVGVALEALSDFGAIDDPRRSQEYLKISKHELNRLTLLVDKVLNMSSMDKGMLKLKMEPINLKKILDDILASMQLHFEKKRVQMTYEIKGENFELEGDRLHLTNVIYNLLDNAVKYSPNAPVLHVALQNHPEKVSLAIKDSGLGISKAYVNKIFNRFFRVPTHDTHDVKGHGLGLSYVQQIVERHNGNIAVESEKGKGSKFTIELPRNQKE